MSENETESLQFYDYLCQKIGSKEVVRARRLLFISNDFGSYDIQISSGSRGEGLDLNGSDFDVMHIDPYYMVYESGKNAIEDQKCVLQLAMDTKESQPCFTYLLLLNNFDNLPQPFKQMFFQHNGNYLLSSEIYKLQLLYLAKQYNCPVLSTIHGPCLSNTNSQYDMAVCLKCDHWIFQARPWISRPRLTWPSSELISKITSCGVLFVPIGYKGSVNEHLQWRISFSVAEKILIYSFSHTQLLCYALLKILLKEIVDTHEDVKGLLCSYFLKTLLFWISEETETSVWRPDNIIPCFMACLQRLIYCIEYSTLLHYFIPENNLFYLRFNSKNRYTLIKILQNSYEIGVNIFSSSETLHDYKRFSSDITRSICKNKRLMKEIAEFYFPFQPPFKNVLRILHTMLHHCKIGLSKSIFSFNFSYANQIMPNALPHIYNPNNKQQYKDYKHDLSQLLVGLHSDAVSGWLKLASFFYVHKNYFASIAIINYTLSKFTDDKILIGQLSFSKITFSANQKYDLTLMTQEKLISILKTKTIIKVIFKAKSSIIPTELKLDVRERPLNFEPLTFAHFLQFLCYFHLQDYTSCWFCISQLLQTILKHKSSKEKADYKMWITLGIAYQMLGLRDLAKTLFCQIAQNDKYNLTSAAFRLSRLS
ncbi:uncharacterized protein LOC143054149 [Mytilus galloprovincialis]|uniref:uncharacterized protein LOC143054149 n=1 Tax=Mytilus galloprovincialis TaxID=29158 RepID=UPI003F7C2603